MLYAFRFIEVCLVDAISYDVALSKRLPCVGGAVGVSRLRGRSIALSAKLTDGLETQKPQDYAFKNTILQFQIKYQLYQCSEAVKERQKFFHSPLLS